MMPNRTITLNGSDEEIDAILSGIHPDRYKFYEFAELRDVKRDISEIKGLIIELNKIESAPLFRISGLSEERLLDYISTKETLFYKINRL